MKYNHFSHTFILNKRETFIFCIQSHCAKHRNLCYSIPSESENIRQKLISIDSIDLLTFSYFVTIKCTSIIDLTNIFSIHTNVNLLYLYNEFDINFCTRICIGKSDTCAYEV